MIGPAGMLQRVYEIGACDFEHLYGDGVLRNLFDHIFEVAELVGFAFGDAGTQSITDPHGHQVIHIFQADSLIRRRTEASVTSSTL